MRSSSRWSVLLTLVCLLAATPLLSGCLERSTTVGDRYSGTVIVATSPDNPRGAPKLDIPESMASRISLSDYSSVPESASATAGATAPTPSTAIPDGATSPSAATDDSADSAAQVPRVGTRAVFTDLTAGQFSQLGDIVAAAFGDSAMSMDLAAKRSGDVVRFRGSADLNDLVPVRDLVQVTITFAGPVTATNGDQIGESTVTWVPEPRKPSDFSADATYSDPATAALSSWSWFLALICVLVVLVVIRLAWSTRDRSPRPGRPRPSAPTAGRKSPPGGSASKTTAGSGAGR